MRLGKTLVGLALLAILPACTESILAVHTIKELNDDGKPEGRYKVGNPYEIKGLTYIPAEDPHYDKIGVASWYGPNFHGKKTANGETFNQWAMTAAHKTLAMPTYARVTNLKNGRSIVVRVNDRGPFAKDRIIDMSRRSAQMLGFEKAGTTRVRVQAVDEFGRFPGPTPSRSRELAAAGVEPKQGTDGDREQAMVARSGKEPVEAVAQDTVIAAEPLGQPVATNVSIQASTTIAGPEGWFVQAAAFSEYANANKAAAALNTLGPVKISETVVGNRSYFRVRVGPFSQEQAAMNTWRQVLNGGYPDARLVNAEQ